MGELVLYVPTLFAFIGVHSRLESLFEKTSLPTKASGRKSVCRNLTTICAMEIGHVLFIDIVGYSKLLIEEQKERLNQLTEIVLTTATVRASTDEQLVRLPTGDGMALVFHHSAEEPARCALEIAEALRKHPEL